jgi:hypothetical protein
MTSVINVHLHDGPTPTATRDNLLVHPKVWIALTMCMSYVILRPWLNTDK